MLAETVAHRELETGKEIHLPEALVLLLKEKQATLDEWEKAIAMYHVTGATGAMVYVEGLEFLRSHFGTQRTLARSPASLPVEEVVAVRSHELL